MRLAKRTEVAIDALAFIGRQGKVVTVDEIHGSLGREWHAWSILRDLSRAGILVSKAGRNGGYSIVRPLHEIKLAEVVTAIEGPLFPDGGDSPLPSRMVNASLRDMVRDGLQKIAVADMVKAAA